MQEIRNQKPLQTSYRARIKRIGNTAQFYQIPAFYTIKKQLKVVQQNNKNAQFYSSIQQSKNNYSYGQPSEPFQPQPHIQIINQPTLKIASSKLGNQIPYSFNRQVTFQDKQSQIQIRNKSPRPLIWNDNKRQSSKKKKLKIFPEKYKMDHKIPIKQNQDIVKLKLELQKIRQDIKNQQFANLTYQNQSINRSSQSNQNNIINQSNSNHKTNQNKSNYKVTQSYNINQNQQSNYIQQYPPTQVNNFGSTKLQAQRTKRLSDLNDYNQQLYNQLALKLKQISNSEYQNYLHQSRRNQILLNQIHSRQSSFLRSSNRKQYNSQYVKDHYKDFIDIHDFQKQYEKSYNHTNKQQSYNHTGKSQSYNQTHKFSHNQSFEASAKIKQSMQIDIPSPFHLKQNNQSVNKQQQYFEAKPSDFTKKLKFDKAQVVYTFNKSRPSSHHFNSTKPLPTNLFIQSTKNDLKSTNQQNQIIPIVKQVSNRNIKPSVSNQNIEIRDMNRHLQDKINRKRIKSQYVYGSSEQRLNNYVAKRK